MKVGPRNAMVIAVVSLALAVDRGARRGARLLRLGGADARARPVGRSTRRELRGARRARGLPDRRRAGNGPYRRHALKVLVGRALRGAGREDRADGQRRAARGRGLGGREPALRAPRAHGAARLEERVRAGGVRLVLGAARRGARVLVPGAGRAGGRARGRDGGGAGVGRGRCTRCRRRSRRRAPCSAASARRG